MGNKLWKDPVWSAVIAAGIVAGATFLLGYWPLYLAIRKRYPDDSSSPSANSVVGIAYRCAGFLTCHPVFHIP